MPISEQAGIVLHRPAGVEILHIAFAVWADYRPSTLYQVTNAGLPFHSGIQAVAALLAFFADSVLYFQQISRHQRERCVKAQTEEYVNHNFGEKEHPGKYVVNTKTIIK